MDVHVRLLAFLGVAALIVITPGVDTALVTKNALAHGRRQAVATALGVGGGIVVWTVASAFGLAAAVRASGAAFDALKLAGGIYLIVLGAQALWFSRSRAKRTNDEPDAASRLGLSPKLAFRQGLRSDLLNPKIAVLFTSLLPQFIQPHGSVLASSLLLGVLLSLMGVVWLLGYALAASRAGSLLRHAAVARWMERVTGSVLIGLGLRVATEHR